MKVKSWRFHFIDEDNAWSFQILEMQFESWKFDHETHVCFYHLFVLNILPVNPETQRAM